MEDLKIEEIKALVALIKWLLSIIGLCIPFVITAFLKIRKDTNEIKTEVTLQNLKHENLEKTVEDQARDHKELAKYVYKRN